MSCETLLQVTLKLCPVGTLGSELSLFLGYYVPRVGVWGHLYSLYGSLILWPYLSLPLAIRPKVTRYSLMGSGQGGARVESSQHKPGNSHYAVGQVDLRELGVLGRVLGRGRLWCAETLTEGGWDADSSTCLEW